MTDEIVGLWNGAPKIKVSCVQSRTFGEKSRHDIELQVAVEAKPNSTARFTCSPINCIAIARIAQVKVVFRGAGAAQLYKRDASRPSEAKVLALRFLREQLR